MVLLSHETGETGSGMIWSDTKRDRPAKMQRIRDPVHGLITFDKNDPETARRDMTAWKLLNTPEMQRLRRVRQLGVSEFTFPGATHTRFAHSVGVFHTARQLLAILTGGKPIEITRISDVVRALQPKLKQVRYYFMNENDRKAGLEGRK